MASRPGGRSDGWRWKLAPGHTRAAPRHGTVTPPPGLVSILLRTRDRPLFLARALDDLAAQTWGDWRAIVVNDGGDPRLVDAAVACRAGALAGRVTILHHAHAKGRGAALNAAFEASTGPFFVVHDDDDTWHPSFLSDTVAFLSDTSHGHFAGVATNCALIRERVENGAILELERTPWPLFESGVDLANMLIGNRIPQHSLLLRREIAIQAGPYDPDLPVLEDWEFYLRILMYADIGTIQATRAFYHVRPEISGDASDNTVVAGADRHRARAVLLQNRAIRLALRENPAAMGILQPLLQRLDVQGQLLTEIRRDVDRRLARLEELMELVHLTAAWHHKLLRPVQRLVSMARAMRRFGGRG